MTEYVFMKVGVVLLWFWGMKFEIEGISEEGKKTFFVEL